MQATVLFNNPAPIRKIETEGIKYAGSKLKLIQYINNIVYKLAPKSILDGFSGTTRVSQAFAQAGYQVISNDIAIWSYHFAQCYLKADRPRKYYQDIISHLNSMPEKQGWFSLNYGAAPENLNIRHKKPWQIHNTRKLDAIREEIDRLELDDIDKSVALTSLMLALDEVDNTLGHYSSYLKAWSPRSYKAMFLKVPALLAPDGRHNVSCGDIFDLIASDKVYDVAYFDPPYGSNNEKMPPSRVRYGAYYHVWTTVCKNDQPKLFGKANRRVDTSDKISSSIFEEFRKDASGKFLAVNAIERLIRETRANHIILSYSTGGRATSEQLHEAIRLNGRVKDVIEVDYKKNVMANMRRTNDWIRETEKTHKELIFVIEKT
ncbi:MAG: DNA adenine methylase [Pseudomonadota bacterium]|nr:DNA adenine methylase [Pseudomonadota bacterium]MDE3038320.1 DNA adenine methylase [Pseudomonadota bacterium]